MVSFDRSSEKCSSFVVEIFACLLEYLVCCSCFSFVSDLYY